MATAKSRTQKLITCDLNCDKAVQQFCNSCQVGLCADCINEHVNSLKSMNHDIVPFTKRTVQLVFPQCTSHSHQRCEAYCTNCDVPVCITCVTGPHNGHDYVPITNIVTEIKENIRKETEEIQSSIIPKNDSCDADVGNKISKCKEHYSDLELEAKDKRKKWQLQVDNIFDTLESLIQSHKDQEMKILMSCQSQLRSRKSSMTKTVQENKEIRKSNKVFDVTNYKSKLTKFSAIPQVPDIRSPSFKTSTEKDRELSVEYGEYRATLTHITQSLSSLTAVKVLFKKANVIATMPTNVKQLLKVACIGSDRAWISGRDKMIQCVDLRGTLQDTVTSTCPRFPDDIAVNKQGELVYSDVDNRTVNIARKGNRETLITTPQGWHPEGLCCTKSGDILVSMTTTDRSHHKIVRYQGQRVTQEIYKDERGNPIYHEGEYLVYVTENNNDDIVASDLNADTVVVVDRTGNVRFRYNDKPPKGQQPFSPRQIVTDSMGHIIVTDYNNDCLHILDQNGKIIKCVDNCGLNNWPHGLSVDNEGRLWVGLYNSGEVKVIQYMK